VNGPGTVIFTRPVGVGAQEAQVLDLHGLAAADRRDHARDGRRVALAVQGAARVVDVDALERGGEAVGVALAAHLAVGEDVQPRALLVADGDEHGVVLRLLEMAGSTRHSSLARTRGGSRWCSASRSMSQSGCG
jgi:hypothetical protein